MGDVDLLASSLQRARLMRHKLPRPRPTCPNCGRPIRCPRCCGGA
jgi:hypothetical protein